MKTIQLILSASVILGTLSCKQHTDKNTPRHSEEDCLSSVYLKPIHVEPFEPIINHPNPSLQVCGLTEDNIRIDHIDIHQDCLDTCIEGDCPADCVHNNDCNSGLVCACASLRPYDENAQLSPEGSNNFSLVALQNTCVPEECTSSNDCEGNPCGFAVDECTIPVGYFCRTDQDECKGQSDCEQWDYCGYDVEQKIWTCQNRASCD